MTEIETERELKSLIFEKKNINNVAFQGLNLLSYEKELDSRKFTDCLFIGCVLGENISKHLLTHNFIFPSLKLPYPTHPAKLYKSDDLYFGFDPSDPESYSSTLDAKIYSHFIKQDRDNLSLRESLAQRMHDHGISDALYDFLDNYEPTRIIAIMGGHSLSRTDPTFLKVAQIAARLSLKGFLMISGGGPGAMEATHLGVWLANKQQEDWDDALQILSTAPIYNDKKWLSTAFEVMEKYPADNGLKSLGIPTWQYGHEPPTPFASHIAKYFANCIREDGLLAIAKGGVIFSPGSAGTIQEIFQDATQNHYLTEGLASPMIFLGKKYWKKTMPIFPLISSLSRQGKYKNLNLAITNSIEKIEQEISKFYTNQKGINLV